MILYAALAWLIAAACVAASVARLRSLGYRHERVERLVAKLRGGPVSRERLSQVASSLDDGDELRQLLEDVLSSPSRAHAVALLNERLSEVAAELDVGAAVPRSAARICAFSGTALALVALIGGLHRLESATLSMAGALAAGVMGGAAAWQVGALASVRENRLRDAWNELVRRLTPLLPPDEP